MPETSSRSSRFWETVSEHVTAKVELARTRKGDDRRSVIVYLRDLEAVARRQWEFRIRSKSSRLPDTIQVIASGRHLLGDHDELPATDAPNARSRHSSGP